MKRKILKIVGAFVLSFSYAFSQDAVAPSLAEPKDKEAETSAKRVLLSEGDGI